jgi:hypothetical protein
MKKVDKRNNENKYKDEGQHKKFVSVTHFIHDIERHHPLSISYKTYWKEIKRRCMEGFWHDGKWMPGPLYFYINLCKIRVDKKGGASTTKVLGKPWLRDLEWEKAYVLMEARGFSGFELDDEYTCYEKFEDFEKLDVEEQSLIMATVPESAMTIKDGQRVRKKYVRARDYLRKIHSKNLGKPIFRNKAWNVIDIEARGGGKSYWGANGIVLHPYLTDGVYDYDAFLEARKDGEPFSVDVMVGAIDGKYTKDLLEKVALSMDSLVGATELQGVPYPSPMMKRHEGSWYSGKQFIENKYKVKKGNEWITKGSRSKIYHRTFKDDEHAGNGIRISIGVLEEVGFMYNLKESLGHMKDTMYSGSRKFGTLYMFGTGGDMEGGSSEAARDVFNDPLAYDCLAFQDVWEDTGNIGFFVPYHLTLNDYKDDEGNSDVVNAKKWIEKKRDKLRKAKNKQPLYHEQQNNPETPGEAFMIIDSNIFPIGELKEHKNWLMSQSETDSVVNGQCGELVWQQAKGEDKEPMLQWKPDLDNRLKPCGFPVKKGDDTTGCIQIWEHPQKVNGQIPFGMYIAGTDPYDQDKAENSSSLGSTFIYKTFYTAEGLYEWPVAEYTARPGTAIEHHENVRKLLIYYNARNLYENEKNTIKMHFEHKNSLYLLTKTPSILKATEGSKVQRGYGIHMTQHIKEELEIYTRDWLTQERGDGKLNLHMLYSIPLVEELIRYNDTGNFDRVISFMLVILHRLQNHKIKVQAVKEEVKAQDSFLTRAFGGKFYG